MALPKESCLVFLGLLLLAVCFEPLFFVSFSTASLTAEILSPLVFGETVAPEETVSFLI